MKSYVSPKATLLFAEGEILSNVLTDSKENGDLLLPEDEFTSGSGDTILPGDDLGN